MAMMNIFAYGTLQDEQIQIALFKRKLKGRPDTLLGYEIAEEKLAGLYPVVFKSPNTVTSLSGMVYELTNTDLEIADDYEGDDYQRIEVVLNSGTRAWVYIGKSQ